ncbi:DNA methyltransferase [Mycobacterium kyorinense]|uniref:DNA methyltransferase n=1 Tax=Mycobacterium kyorinense TaxID=487514 RepID=A0A1X1YHL4_9MYCO|nr:DNA methyltransferase [Mycobacterium kyorinense]
MSRLTDLISAARDLDTQLGADLTAEFKALSERLSYGLNFERHRPETVELPKRPIRRGDKVRVLPPRGSRAKGDARLWLVKKVEKVRTKRRAHVETISTAEPESKAVDCADLVVVAEFRDTIYPGLAPTGKVEHGSDKPYHTVINGENYHVLKALTFTHRGKVDVIYIDPPYNTRDKDWKYNNDFVDSKDIYRHSKWLAFMERRLKLAGELLNPRDAVLIVTIDEKEVHRLGLLLEQVFPEARIQMISTVINRKGVYRDAGFRRVDEYIYFVMFGTAAPARMQLGADWALSVKEAKQQKQVPRAKTIKPDWTSMMRRGSESARTDRPTMFYPIYADPTSRAIVEVGDPLPEGVHKAPRKKGLVPILPLRRNGAEGRWQIGIPELLTRMEQGRVRLGNKTAYGYVVNYLPDGAYADVMSDKFEIEGYAPDGSLIARGYADDEDDDRVPPSQWNIAAHNASEYGSTLLGSLIPGRKFPYPKSLFAVEDALRFFVANKPQAVIVDFFAGSGTTTHAVMRLNRLDGGRRQSIIVTNNEVSAEEQAALRKQKLRPGDSGWECWGICDYITKPRIEAAITGKTPEGKVIEGSYKFAPESKISDGFEENAAFFTLTYETPISIGHHRAYAQVAPLLWLRAGGVGRCIDPIPETGWDIAETYGIVVDLDRSADFCEAIKKAEGLRIAYVVTDDDRRFQSVARHLPDALEVVQLYEDYLLNFQFTNGD